MVEAVLMMGGLGLVIGAGLAVASKLFYVWVDPKIEAVESVLPGANCGGCGLPGCSANAAAIVAGTASPSSCVAGGSDLAAAIAQMMGVSIEAKEPDVARPGCFYGVEEADQKFIYAGLSDCRAAALFGGGMKVCTIGCLGLGTCVKACPFDALAMGEKGLPVVDPAKCTGCGTCEKVCPKHIITLSSVTRRILREYTTDECTTPCQRACPAGIDIREYIRQIELGDPHRAVQVIKERNPFPAVIGRICPRPCELDCRRKLVDTPVAINYLKRYAADIEMEKGERILPFKAPATGRRIAVAGGGVEGLSTAFFIARLGHEPTVFEATSRFGGLLRCAIAEKRLPEEVLDWDVEGILKMGVNARTNVLLGRDVTVDSLLSEGFQAVFLASGGWDSRLAFETGLPAQPPVPGTFLMIDFMRGDAEARKMMAASPVVIAGGGKGAVKTAKILKELGIPDVVIALREPRDKSPFSEEEATALAADGIAVLFHKGIGRLYGEGDRLTGVACIDLETGATERLSAASLILAAGRFPELIFTRAEEAGSWTAIGPYKSPSFSGEIGLFSAADPLTDYTAAIRAIGGGRRVAASIHQVIYGIDPMLPESVITRDAILQDVDALEGVAPVPRRIMPVSSPRELETGRELEKGFTPEMAQKEASRCLQCGLICYERE
jgi:NADPH-dependent glutamate synthase beta subunit-like oxidoreductase/NAD-dependent dihydropyrimidine dehydrogenase PreA subunit